MTVKWTGKSCIHSAVAGWRAGAERLFPRTQLYLVFPGFASSSQLTEPPLLSSESSGLSDMRASTPPPGSGSGSSGGSHPRGLWRGDLVNESDPHHQHQPVLSGKQCSKVQHNEASEIPTHRATTSGMCLGEQSRGQRFARD